MRNISICITIIVLLVSLMACDTKESQYESDATSADSATTSESHAKAYEQYPSLANVIDTIIKPGLYWRFELPNIERLSYNVEVTPELQAAAYEILTEYEPQFQPEMLADETRDCDWENGTIYVGIDGSDDGFYPNGEQLVFATFVQLGANDPIAPNTTFLAIGIGDDSYTFPAEVYVELLALFSANVVETRADFEGEYVRLKHEVPDMYGMQQTDMLNWDNGDIFEIDNLLVYSRFARYDDAYEYWQIQFFDLDTGEVPTVIEYQGKDESLGNLLRVEKLNHIPDYDFCMYYEKGYVYRNSKDTGKQMQFTLPEEVKPVVKSDHRATSYDEYGDYFAWVADDGIYLRTAKQDGITQKLILPDAQLSEMFPRSDYAEDIVYVMPRFIGNGSKIAAMVYSPLAYNDVGVVIYDIASGEISSMLQYYPPATALYPLSDRYAATWGLITAPQILDTESGETTEINAWLGRSYDYNTFIVMDYSTLDAENAPAYVCDISDLSDRSKLLLRPGNPYVWVGLTAATENHAVFSVSDADGSWIAVAKYR